MSTTRFTVADYDRMIEFGAPGKYDKVELIEGRLSPKPPRSHRHVVAGNMGFAVLRRIAPAGWHAAKGDPVVASEWSKPDPDLMLIRGDILDYDERFEILILDYDERDVTTKDVALVVEIADSSLAVDRNVKARLYAAGGVPVYWIVNLVDDLVEVYSDPAPIQGYQTRRDHRRGESIPVLADGRELGLVAVDDLLPPKDAA